MKIANIQPHNCCGDDLKTKLESSQTVYEGLHAWADDLEKSVKAIRKIAHAIKDKHPRVEAFDHYIDIYNLDENTLKLLDQIGMVTIENISEEAE